MTSLSNLRKYIHNISLRYRNIENVISGSKFKSLWEKSDDESRFLAYFFITSGNLKELKRWMKEHPDLDLDELTMHNLRRMGQRLKIKNYCRLPKGELVYRIGKEIGKPKN